MMQKIPKLAILPVDKLRFHEIHDDQRTPSLIENFRSTGVLRNPPIVTPIPDAFGLHAILDGANRLNAFQQMGMPHILVQVVEHNNPNLSLNSWNHVIVELSGKNLHECIHSVPRTKLIPCKPERGYQDLSNRKAVALIHTVEKNMYSVHPLSENLEECVEILFRVVNSYYCQACVERTYLSDIHTIMETYPEMKGLVLFPRFDIEEILHIVNRGLLLPPGVTRFIVSPRVLQVNYPLEKLADSLSLEEKNKDLDEWLHERLCSKKVRYYAESTFLFDE
ncbi:MAG: hypothetical protein AB1345_06430 [Chloroflexota bacterium]